MDGRALHAHLWKDGHEGSLLAQASVGQKRLSADTEAVFVRDEWSYAALSANDEPRYPTPKAT